MFEPTLNKRIKVRYSPPNEIPLIFGDKGQIEQAILNIAVNAVDAISSKLSDPLHFGEISFELKQGPLPVRYATPYKIEPSEKFIHLHIRDNGTGIPEQIQEKIFEPFFTTKDVGKGTGLGLAMVYGIIKNHNGFIFVESKLGEGTSFHIFLPPDYSQHSDTTPSIPLEILKTNSARILVVDDEAMIRNYLTDSLTAAGFSIETAVNGLEACQAVANSPQKYDLILIDRNMPELNGEESIARIREITTYPKLIMMTGYLENNRFEELERLGVSFIIQKPFTFEKLIEIISLALKK